MFKWITSAALAVWLSLFAPAGVASAAVTELRVPLHDGRLRTADLSAALCRELHLPECKPNVGEMDLRGAVGSQFVQSMNLALGEGCNVALAGDGAALLVRVDSGKLPKDCEAAKRAVRVFTAAEAPEATAAQAAFYGIDLPAGFDPNRPLVLLVHGLDADKYNWQPMRELLAGVGYQSATFTYPSDQPIEDSAAFFGQHFAAVRQKYPRTPLHVVAHSMGSLVARAYIEGPTYAGGIDRLILIAPPNHGSSWARWRAFLEIQEHYHLWQHEPNWHWTWMITDGLGEAGTDLKPGSKFLKALNARPRRDGVRYTIVAGTHHEACRITADCVAATGGAIIPNRAAGWWGVRHCKAGIESAAAHFREREGDSDGPVKVKSAKLKGVDDFVLVHADHAALYVPIDGNPPAAWSVVRERLGKVN